MPQAQAPESVQVSDPMPQLMQAALLVPHVLALRGRHSEPEQQPVLQLDRQLPHAPPTQLSVPLHTEQAWPAVPHDAAVLPFTQRLPSQHPMQFEGPHASPVPPPVVPPPDAVPPPVPAPPPTGLPSQLTRHMPSLQHCLPSAHTPPSAQRNAVSCEVSTRRQPAREVTRNEIVTTRFVRDMRGETLAPTSCDFPLGGDCSLDERERGNRC